MNVTEAREFESLLWVATDIRTVRIPETLRLHGVGEEVSAGIAVMLTAALDCVRRATALFEKNDSDVEVLESLYLLAAKLEDQIACHLEEAQAWRLAVAMAEAAKSTKH